MKLFVLSDLHFVDYYHWNFILSLDPSRFDAILCLGDIDIMYLKSLKESFSNNFIVGVLGNHDYFGDLEYLQIPNLHGKVTLFQNMKFLGVEGCIHYKKSQSFKIHK